MATRFNASRAWQVFQVIFIVWCIQQNYEFFHHLFLSGLFAGLSWTLVSYALAVSSIFQTSAARVAANISTQLSPVGSASNESISLFNVMSNESALSNIADVTVNSTLDNGTREDHSTSLNTRAFGPFPEPNPSSVLNTTLPPTSPNSLSSSVDVVKAVEVARPFNTTGVPPSAGQKISTPHTAASTHYGSTAVGRLLWIAEVPQSELEEAVTTSPPAWWDTTRPWWNTETPSQEPLNATAIPHGTHPTNGSTAEPGSGVLGTAWSIIRFVAWLVTSVLLFPPIFAILVPYLAVHSLSTGERLALAFHGRCSVVSLRLVGQAVYLPLYTVAVSVCSLDFLWGIGCHQNLATPYRLAVYVLGFVTQFLIFVVVYGTWSDFLDSFNTFHELQDRRRADPQCCSQCRHTWLGNLLYSLADLVYRFMLQITPPYLLDTYEYGRVSTRFNDIPGSRPVVLRELERSFELRKLTVVWLEAQRWMP